MKKFLIIFGLVLGFASVVYAHGHFCCSGSKEECCAEKGKMYCPSDNSCRTRCPKVTPPACIGGCINPDGDCCRWCPSAEVCAKMGKCQKIVDGCYDCVECPEPNPCPAPKCMNQDGECCPSCPRVCPEGQCLVNLDGCYECGSCGSDDDDDDDDDDVDDDDDDDDDECPVSCGDWCCQKGNVCGDKEGECCNADKTNCCTGGTPHYVSYTELSDASGEIEKITHKEWICCEHGTSPKTFTGEEGDTWVECCAGSGCDTYNCDEWFCRCEFLNDVCCSASSPHYARVNCDYDEDGKLTHYNGVFCKRSERLYDLGRSMRCRFQLGV